MKKFLFAILLMTYSLEAKEVEYSKFYSSNALIAYETVQILTAEKDNLADCYLDRGESYLIMGDVVKALEDFQKAHELRFEIRSLFDMTVAYALLGEETRFYEGANFLQNYISCRPCKDAPIYGPDEEPYDGWCEEVVKGTAQKMNFLIELVPRVEVRITLQILVDGLRREALKCCADGGLWKACVGPLVKKWVVWNEKWKLFHIPPNPAWDD